MDTDDYAVERGGVALRLDRKKAFDAPHSPNFSPFGQSLLYFNGLDNLDTIRVPSSHNQPVTVN